MAQLEVIALDTAVPQLRAPGGSDTYLMPKDLTIQGTATVDSGSTLNGGVVVNELGADVDFRIESDTNSNAFVLDGGNDNIGIGGTASAFVKVHVLGTLPTSSNASQAFRAAGTIPSGATSSAAIFQSTPATEAASFTLANLRHFQASQGTFGAGSTVTIQYGFEVASNLTDATNNYGFYSNIASGSNRWNLYCAGSASNYLAGNLGIGSASLGSIRFRIRGSDATSSNYAIYIENSTPAAVFYVRNSGRTSTGAEAESPYNYTSGSAANVYVDSSGILYRSTSSLRYKSDVADATHGLVDVLKLRSVTYKAKNSGDTVFGGLIAEEVHDAGLTEFVAYDNEGRPDALHYGNMVALLVKAVQELKAELDTLKGNA